MKLRSLFLLFLPTITLMAADPAADKDAPSGTAMLKAATTPEEQARACQQLTREGNAEAIPLLAPLLEDQRLSAYARGALEAIDDPAAGQALRDAVPRLKGLPLIGVIQSIGVRADAKALALMDSLVKNPDRGAAAAALGALGRIATDDAVIILKRVLAGDEKTLHIPAGHALMDCATRWSQAGKMQPAVALFDHVHTATLPPRLRAAAAGMIFSLGTAEALPLFKQLLKSEEKEMEEALLRGTDTLPRVLVLQAMDAASADAPESVKARCELLRNRIKSMGETRRIFDGKTFRGWESQKEWFRIEDGAVVAGSLERPIPHNAFLCTGRQFGDFELRLLVKLSGKSTNGGIQFRSQRAPEGTEMVGYQADAAAAHWGGLYDESRRRRFLVPKPDKHALTKILHPNDWNEYVIRCEGARIRMWLNGMLTVDYTEKESHIPRTGRIALQIHSGDPTEVRYKDIELLELAP